jgi:hypothetical protein
MIEPVSIEYVAARRVLLDAVEALRKHPDPVVLIGAQAIYVRTGSADFDVAVAPYTTDADLALNPEVLGTDPQIDQVLPAAGFTRTSSPGRWVTTVSIGTNPLEVPIDLMVPEAVAGRGSRSAELQGQAKNAARRGRGLEAALVDNDRIVIKSFDPDDPREVEVTVASAAALLIAKAHKLGERVAKETTHPDRVKPKDASDVYRLVLAEPGPEVIGRRLRDLSTNELTAASVQEGVEYLRTLFSRRRQRGVELAVEALGAGGVPAETVEAVLTAYFGQLLAAYEAE